MDSLFFLYFMRYLRFQTVSFEVAKSKTMFVNRARVFTDREISHFQFKTLNYPHLFAIVIRLAYVHTFLSCLNPSSLRTDSDRRSLPSSLRSSFSFSYLLMVTNPIFCTFRKQATIHLGVIANIFTSVIIYVITKKTIRTKIN